MVRRAAGGWSPAARAGEARGGGGQGRELRGGPPRAGRAREVCKYRLAHHENLTRNFILNCVWGL
eukprot:1679618-Lingulodinium_polyedra.AAC.1